jgi:hypothetical protein
MIIYTNELEMVKEEMLKGFFVGWPNPLSASTRMEILNNSYLVWVAIDTANNKIIGFINAIALLNKHTQNHLMLFMNKKWIFIRDSSLLGDKMQ